MPVTRARLDRRVAITPPTTIDAANDLVVVTPLGLVLVGRHPGWTWYRWAYAGKLWSVTVECNRTTAQATREAARLCRQTAQRRRRPASPTA